MARKRLNGFAFAEAEKRGLSGAIHRAKTGALAVSAITSSLPNRCQASLSKTKEMVQRASASLLWVSSVRGYFAFDL